MGVTGEYLAVQVPVAHWVRWHALGCPLLGVTARAEQPQRAGGQWSLPGQLSWLSLLTCQWRMGEGKQNRYLSQLPASTGIVESE